MQFWVADTKVTLSQAALAMVSLTLATCGLNFGHAVCTAGPT